VPAAVNRPVATPVSGGAIGTCSVPESRSLSTSRLVGDGDRGRDESPAVARALDPKPAVEGGDPVPEPDETVPVRPGASDAIVTHLDGERAVPSIRATTSACPARACLATLVSASAMTK
jgi:hypothetical protein